MTGSVLLLGLSSGERNLRVLHCSSWTVFNARCTGCTVLLKDKIVINDAIIASDI